MKEDPFTVDFTAELRAAERALKLLKEKLETAPGHDWRASCAWEAVEAAQDVLGQGMFDAFEIPSFDRLRPEWRYWRDKYANKTPF